MKVTFILLWSIFLTLQGIAQSPLKTEEDAKILSDDFIRISARGDFQEAFDLLKPHWQLEESEIDQLAGQIQEHLGRVKERFGKVVGAELIHRKQLGKSLLQFSYLQKFANHPIRWRIYFYRAQDDWRVNSVLVDDKVEEYFEE